MFPFEHLFLYFSCPMETGFDSCPISPSNPAIMDIPSPTLAIPQSTSPIVTLPPKVIDPPLASASQPLRKSFVETMAPTNNGVSFDA